MTDPNPNHKVAFSLRDRAVMNSNARGIESGMAFQRFESNRAMVWIQLPEPVTFVGQSLCSLREQSVMSPEFRGRFRGQTFDSGQSRNVPFRTALRASSTRKSSFPAAASLAICRSQSSSTSNNQLSSSSRSFTESAPAAFLISSTVLTWKS